MLPDELTLLLTLNGNKRIPYLEEEIFADKTLTTTYLHELCKSFYWNDTNISDSWRIYYYACIVLGGPWPEAEHIILRIPHHWPIVGYYKSLYEQPF